MGRVIKEGGAPSCHIIPGQSHCDRPESKWHMCGSCHEHAGKRLSQSADHLMKRLNVQGPWQQRNQGEKMVLVPKSVPNFVLAEVEKGVYIDGLEKRRRQKTGESHKEVKRLVEKYGYPKSVVVDILSSLFKKN